MDRLTIRLPDNLGCVPAERIGWQEIADRLAAYEDTGLEPEEVKSLKETWDLFGGPDGIQRAFMERDKYLDALLGNQGQGLPAPPVVKRQRVEIVRCGDRDDLAALNELLAEGWQVSAVSQAQGFSSSRFDVEPYTEYLLEREETDDGH